MSSNWFDYIGIYNSVEFNNTDGTYNVTISLNNSTNTTKKISNLFRIYNDIGLAYDSTTPGYFYISNDNKYIYLDGTNPSLNIKYINYVINNKISNDKLLTLLTTLSNSNVKTIIYNSKISDDFCINLALETDTNNRIIQLENLNNNPYANYDCFIKTYIINKNLNQNTPSNSRYNLSMLNKPVENMDTTEPRMICNSNNLTYTEYNKYYMYGLTFMNGLLLIIAVAMIFMLFEDNINIKNKNKL